MGWEEQGVRLSPGRTRDLSRSGFFAMNFKFFFFFFFFLLKYSSSLVAQMAKNLPAMWETWVQSLGWEDPLEKEMATYSSILAWRIPWTEEPGGL